MWSFCHCPSTFCQHETGLVRGLSAAHDVSTDRARSPGLTPRCKRLHFASRVTFALYAKLMPAVSSWIRAAHQTTKPNKMQHVLYRHSTICPTSTNTSLTCFAPPQKGSRSNIVWLQATCWSPTLEVALLPYHRTLLNTSNCVSLRPSRIQPTM